MTREFHAAHLRHVDIDQHQIGSVARQCGEGLVPVGALADNIVRVLRRAIAKQFAHAFPRRLFIINNQDAQDGGHFI